MNRTISNRCLAIPRMNLTGYSLRIPGLWQHRNTTYHETHPSLELRSRLQSTTDVGNKADPAHQPSHPCLKPQSLPHPSAQPCTTPRRTGMPEEDTLTVSGVSLRVVRGRPGRSSVKAEEGDRVPKDRSPRQLLWPGKAGMRFDLHLQRLVQWNHEHRLSMICSRPLRSLRL